MERKNLVKRVWRFYRDGFREMSSTGRTLWLLILIKLFIIFVVLRLFFFHPVLGGMKESEKEEHVAGSLMNNP